MCRGGVVKGGYQTILYWDVLTNRSPYVRGQLWFSLDRVELGIKYRWSQFMLISRRVS